jgi:hypothetical protein
MVLPRGASLPQRRMAGLTAERERRATCPSRAIKQHCRRSTWCGRAALLHTHAHTHTHTTHTHARAHAGPRKDPPRARAPRRPPRSPHWQSRRSRICVAAITPPPQLCRHNHAANATVSPQASRSEGRRAAVCRAALGTPECTRLERERRARRGRHTRGTEQRGAEQRGAGQLEAEQRGRGAGPARRDPRPPSRGGGATRHPRVLAATASPAPLCPACLPGGAGECGIRTARVRLCQAGTRVQREASAPALSESLPALRLGVERAGSRRGLNFRISPAVPGLVQRP